MRIIYHLLHMIYKVHELNKLVDHLILEVYIGMWRIHWRVVFNVKFFLRTPNHPKHDITDINSNQIPLHFVRRGMFTSTGVSFLLPHST